MLSQQERIDFLRRRFERWQRDGLKVLGHKNSKEHRGFRPALPGILCRNVVLHKVTSLAPASNLADWAQHFGSKHPLHRAVGFDHVLPPACYPHLPFLAPYEQISILIAT